MHVTSREPVIYADDFDGLITWWESLLALSRVAYMTEPYHYAVLSSAGGFRVGFSSASEMQVSREANNNRLVLQIEVEDVRGLLSLVGDRGGRVTGPASEDPSGFWYGAFCDVEGNECWVVDPRCP